MTSTASPPPIIKLLANEVSKGLLLSLLLLLVVVALKYAKFKPYSDRNKILDRAKQEKISKLMDRME